MAILFVFLNLLPLVLMIIFRMIAGTIKQAKWVGLVFLILACWSGGLFTPWRITDMIICLALIFVAYRYSCYPRVDMAVTTLSSVVVAIVFIVLKRNIFNNNWGKGLNLDFVTYILIIIGTVLIVGYQLKRKHKNWMDDGGALLLEENQRIVAAAIYGLIAALLFTGLLQVMFKFLETSNFVFLPSYLVGAVVAYLYIGLDKKTLTTEE